MNRVIKPCSVILEGNLFCSSEDECPICSPVSDSSSSEEVSSDEIFTEMESINSDITVPEKQPAEDSSECPSFGFIMVDDNIDHTVRP